MIQWSGQSLGETTVYLLPVALQAFALVFFRGALWASCGLFALLSCEWILNECNIPLPDSVLFYCRVSCGVVVPHSTHTHTNQLRLFTVPEVLTIFCFVTVHLAYNKECPLSQLSGLLLGHCTYHTYYISIFHSLNAWHREGPWFSLGNLRLKGSQLAGAEQDCSLLETGKLKRIRI